MRTGRWAAGNYLLAALNPRHFLSLADFNAADLGSLLDDADQLRRAWHARTMPQSLSGRRVALWFFDSGFRNRVAFDIGAQSMGARVVYVPGGLGRREDVRDMAAYLANWFDAAVVRAEHHHDLLTFAQASGIPIINARTDHSHPCEALGDLHYIRRIRGSLDGLRVAFVGEASNLCYPWLEAAASLPISVTQICPEGYEVDAQVLAGLSRSPAGELSVTHDFDVVRGVDVIYTDCWPKRETDADCEIVARLFSPYRITRAVLESCKPGVMFLPCPPVTRGEEVDSDAMAHRACRVYEAKESLLHAQNAILQYLIK